MVFIELENKGLRELLKISGILFLIVGISEEEVFFKNNFDYICILIFKE